MKKSGKIDHIVYSFFINANGSPVMKVGSVDDNASIGNLTLIETMGKDTWKLKGTYFMYDYTDLSKSDERGVIIDPNFPYVYIPDSDFLRFAE